MIDIIFNKLDQYFNKYRLRRILLFYIPALTINAYLWLMIYEAFYNLIYGG